MVRNQLGHLEHRDLGFTAEHGFELVVGVDHATVGSVLHIMLLDVLPHFFRHFGAWQRGRAHDTGEGIRGGHGLHEGGVWLAGCCWLFGRCGFRRGGLGWSCFFRCWLGRCCWLGRGFFCWRCCWGFFGCCHLRAS